MPYPTKTTSDLSTLISGSRRADEATKSSGYFRSIVLSPIVNDIRGSLLIPARGTSCVYVPSGFPGFNPIFLNWSAIYLTESSSPFVPGARPSNSSDARTLMCASKPSGVIASSAGCKRNASSSSARSEAAAKQTIAASGRVTFVIYADVVAAFGSNAERNNGIFDRHLAQAPLQLSAFLRRPRRGFLFVLWTDADLFQERLYRLLAAEKFLDGNVYITRIAWLVNFAAQFHAGLFIEIAVLRFFKNGSHIGGDRIGPGVAVVPGVVAIEMSKVGNKGRARIDWQKHFFQDRVRDSHAIVRHIFRVGVVQSQVERRERELASIKNSSVCQLCVIHLFDNFRRDLS